MQVPEPNDPDDAITRPQGRVGVVDVFLFLPHDNRHVERDPVHVNDDAKHAVQHAYRQRQLKLAGEAREQFHARAVCGPQIPDVRRAERGNGHPRGRPSGRRRRHPAHPPRVFRLPDQRLDVAMQRTKSQVQGHAHQVEKLLDYDARDIGQRREQANQFCGAERKPAQETKNDSLGNYETLDIIFVYDCRRARITFLHTILRKTKQLP